MQWFNEPPVVQAEGAGPCGDVLRVTVGARTDFWRKTHDGGMRDSGHFCGQPVTGDFVAEVKVTGQYTDLYDQAGLMVRQDEKVWMKCGIEYLHGVQQASTVVTHDWSDWSVTPLANPPAIWLRVVRHAATVEVYYSLDGEAYTMIRQAYLTEAPTVQVGPMAAAPTGNGFPVTFEGFRVVPVEHAS
jgi:regulation of enolase protein 1 (concanavalin A-like superfamily)